MTDKPRHKLGIGGAATIAGMVAVLAASVWFAYWGWNLTDATVSTNGMTALVLGIVVTSALGAGLMALVYWSNRKGYDR